MNKRRGWTIEELAEMDGCPCEICSSQDDEETILEREKLKELDEVCDLFSNEIIDLVIKNPKKYLLKRQNKQDNVK
ncbi:hypothetical protein C4577_00400 [Candidatus Parcubacteria bacterium]|nr:MAG: hypothetical protein C4577_00400 [Candidatus Parcubacteria bacterium]